MTATVNRRHFFSVSPQVETAACFCGGVDAGGGGGVSVGGGRRFVPGRTVVGHCVRPDIKPAIVTVAKKPTRGGERRIAASELLPGLPDDLAIECLIRVPRFYHRKLRVVCKGWRSLLAGKNYYHQRRTLGKAEEWVYVIKRDREGRISWHAFDPRYQLWQPLPPVPVEYSEALGFGCAVLSGCNLYLFGGKDPVKGSMRRVVYYSAQTNKWHRAKGMQRRRHFFGFCVINNCLFVAGGECEGVQRSLRSAEMYDPNRKKWCYISDMSTAMVPFIGVVFGGRWFLKGLGTHRQVMSEVYEPATNNWSPIFNGMVAGWRNPCVELQGNLYALDCRDGCKLRMYDSDNDAWSLSADSRLHLGGSRAMEAVAIVPLGGKLCIIRNNMSITLVDVVNADIPEKQGQLWETISGKGQFKSFVTNLWSNLAGGNRLKSHIVHCQVLQA
ncbi:hypothetical protein BDL97_01G041700 [Sphagnum fallax]|nr:hypothetical protein BDL97_01G041700 [Sphagnum fallax]